MEQELLSVFHSAAGILSPHQQFTPSDKPMTFLFSCKHTNWQLPGLRKSYGPWFSRGVPVAKQPISTKALARRVTVGVVMGFLMVVDGVSSAAAVSRIEAAARADANLMRTMVEGMMCGCCESEVMVSACPLNQQMWTIAR